jgi:hypothetical protein
LDCDERITVEVCFWLDVRRFVDILGCYIKTTFPTFRSLTISK